MNTKIAKTVESVLNRPTANLGELVKLFFRFGREVWDMLLGIEANLLSNQDSNNRAQLIANRQIKVQLTASKMLDRVQSFDDLEASLARISVRDAKQAIVSFKHECDEFLSEVLIDLGYSLSDGPISKTTTEELRNTVCKLFRLPNLLRHSADYVHEYREDQQQSIDQFFDHSNINGLLEKIVDSAKRLAQSMPFECSRCYDFSISLLPHFSSFRSLENFAKFVVSKEEQSHQTKITDWNREQLKYARALLIDFQTNWGWFQEKWITANDILGIGGNGWEDIELLLDNECLACRDVNFSSTLLIDKDNRTVHRPGITEKPVSGFSTRDLLLLEVLLTFGIDAASGPNSKRMIDLMESVESNLELDESGLTSCVYQLNKKLKNPPFSELLISIPSAKKYGYRLVNTLKSNNSSKSS